MTVGTVVLALALLVGLVATKANAQPLSNYAVTSWADRDGVPIGTVYAIAQDHAGYLWLGTAGGLVRFDGLRFSPAAHVVRGLPPSSAVGAVSIMADGSLLVGFATGEVRRIRDLELLPVTEPDHTLGRIDAVVEDRTGTIWAIADGRAHRQRDRRFEAIAVGSPAVRVVNAYLGVDRTLYLATGRGLFRQTAAGDFQQLSNDFVYAVSQGRTGDLWVTHPLYGFVRASDSVYDAALIGNGYRAIHDREGSLWVATIGKGLWRVQLDSGVRPSRVRVAPIPALPDDSAQALFEDREGNIWIGTPTGLHRLTRKPLTPVVNAGPILAAEATTEGSGVWAGTRFDGLIRFVREGDAWRRTVHSPRNVMIRSLHRDAAGTLWIGTNIGLGRLVDDRLQLVARPSAAPQVSWLTSDSRGTLWLGDGRRLFRFSGGHLSEVTTKLQPRPVAFAVADRQGRLWLALADGTIQAIDSHGDARDLGTDGFGTTNRVVYCIFEDSRGDVWFGASDGLHRYAGGRLSTVTLSSDWPGNQVWAIVEDDQRFLWLNTDLGVLRIHPDELTKATADPAYRMHYRVFDGHDGLGGAAVEYLRAARGSNGTLWFSRGGVLTAVDPGGLPSTDRIAHPVRIESVTTEQGPFDLTSGRTLAAGTRRLDVNFSVLHLSPTPRLRFRHRLEGFESDWRDAGTRPVASYTNLSPGAYKLVVEAFSTQGRFGSAAVWEFRVPPTLSQSPAFRAMAVLAAVLVVGLAWWARTRMVRRQFAAVLAERARVSREIHDTLLQGVVGIGLQLDHLEQSQTGDPAENARRFQRLRLLLEGYVREARRSILDLRAPVLERRSFEDALNDIGTRLTANTNIQFVVTVKGKPRGCSARMENELLRIAHEAIANAVRHSSAHSIQVQLRFEEKWVALRVTDDGCGFNVERVATASHTQFGLVSMKERAKMLGGDLRVETAVHRGTDIEAVFPLRVAT